MDPIEQRSQKVVELLEKRTATLKLKRKDGNAVLENIHGKWSPMQVRIVTQSCRAKWDRRVTKRTKVPEHQK
eukprot:747789-Hanusia_phi.AAC.1